MNDQNKTELLGMNQSELEEFVTGIHEPKFRAGSYINGSIKTDGFFYEMSDIPRDLRFRLDETPKYPSPDLLTKSIPRRNRKFLLEMNDKKKVETVIIPQNAQKKLPIHRLYFQSGGMPGWMCFLCDGAGGFQRQLWPLKLSDRF
jgi:23S rRNA (adenine2503-C2)-methyltransferase